MDIVSAVQNILYIDKMYYIKCRNAKKIKKTLTKQEKSRYNSALLKQNAQAYDAVRYYMKYKSRDQTSHRETLKYVSRSP